MNANETLKQLPALFNGEGAKDVKASFQMNVTQPCYIHIENGVCTIIDGQAPNPDLTLNAADEVLIKLLKGQINSMMAIATGKVKVSGNMMLATKLNDYFDMAKLN